MKSSLIVISIFAIVLISVGLFVPEARTFTSIAFDRSAPTIKILTPIGKELKVELLDQHSGMLSALVTASQNEKVVELVRHEFKTTSNKELLTVPLNLKSLGFKEGQVKFDVSVMDRALFANNSSAHATELLDFTRPRLELISLQHIVHQGGVELLVFKAQDNNFKGAGVKVGDYVFPAFPLSYLNQANSEPDLYGALLALPFDFNPNASKIVLFAEDQVLNRSELGVSFRVGSFKQPSVNPKLTRSFLESKIPELYEKYLEASNTKSDLDLSTDQGLLEAFKAVNGDYRALLDSELNQLLEGSITPRQGNGAFIKPMASATSSKLGEQRHYTYNGQDAGYSLHQGLDLASVQNDAVLSAQDGTVILAKDLGIYGQTVVIDHGATISTLYGHLSSVLVSVGEKVSKGQTIGRSGTTGLAGGDHLHFEIRVRAKAVNPIEWWDEKWIQDNIDGKLAN